MPRTKAAPNTAKLTDALCRDAPPCPAESTSATKTTWDTEIKGFGLRVTKAGTKAFVLNYRYKNQLRQLTIGSFPEWTVKAARKHASDLKTQIDKGADPQNERRTAREAPDMAYLADWYKANHMQRKAPSSQRNDELNLRLHILPSLGRKKLVDVQHRDIAKLHAELSKTHKAVGNRVVALLSKMFALAIKQGWATTNPAKGVEKTQETKRDRYLTVDEIARLMESLHKRGTSPSANAVRLLLLTGARRGEVLGATWDQFNLDEGIWTKPAATTKQRKLHRVPLNGTALELLRAIHSQREARLASARAVGRILLTNEYVFPGRDGTKCLTEIKKLWAKVCEEANIENVHLHDLRHTHASILASEGMSLPVIGQLLGHTQASTTQRYAHLFDETLREATERVSTVVANATKKVLPLK